MATPRILRFDAEGRLLKFSIWLLRARRLLESQVQAHETPVPADPTPLAADPTPADSDRYARERADVTAWKSRDVAACIALSSLLPESEETHFTQVRTAGEFLTAIKARYTTPTTVSLGHMFLPFLFPDLASFERTPGLITHLRSLDSSYRAACTDAQLALLPPPMAITIYFIATSLPDRLASVRDTLLLKHPSELTIEVLESALKDVESNLRSVASTSGAVPPPLFHRCTVPQLPTLTASLATAATDMTAAAVTTSSRSRSRSGRRGGQSAGGGGGSSGGDVASGGGGSAGAGGAPRAATGESLAAEGGGDARVRQPPTGPPAAGGGAAACQPCGRSHPPGQCLAQLTDTVRLAYGVDSPAPDWLPLVQTYDPALWGMSASQLVDLFGTSQLVDLSSASESVYSSVVSLGASLFEVPATTVRTCVDTSPGAAPKDASLSFILDSGASHYFFRDHMTLTPLPTPVSVAVADPTSGPVTARYTTTLPCPAVPSGSLTGFHVPSFSRNLVGVRPLVSQHVGVRIEPSGETAGSSSSSSSGNSSSSSSISSSYCPRPLSLSPVRFPVRFWCLVQFLRRAPAHPTRPFLACALRLGPASRPGPERESFFLVVVDDYSRYTTVFPLAKKSNVTSTLIRWLLTTADTRGRRVSCLHSDHGGLVMEIARTSMTHARAPHFLWPYTVRYAAHQLNLWPRVSQPEVSPTSLWTGSPGAASRFRVWGCLELVRDTSADKISPRAVSCVFLGFPENSSDYTFYHPPLHQFFDSRGVRFDEFVPYYVRYPCQGLLVPHAPLFVTSAPPRAPLVQPPPPSLAPSGVSHATPPPSVAPKVQLPSPQSSQPIADPAGAGFCGEDPGGASSRGAGVGAESVPVRGLGSGGAGVGAEPVTAGDSSLRGAGVSGVVPGSATTGGAPSAGPGEPGTDPVTFGGAGSGGGATGSLESGPGATTTPETTPPPHPYPTRHQAHVRRAVRSSCITEFASTRCLDYATSLVAAPPTSPLAVGGESALGCDALEDRQFELEFLVAASPHLCAMLLAPDGDPDALDILTPRTYAEAVSGPWASQWRAAMDSEMASYRSTGIYVVKVPPLGANVVNGMWIFRVKRPPGSPPVFKARYIARGFSQREGVDFFHTFAPTPKMTTLRVLLHIAAQRDYKLHSLDFSTDFLQGSLHEEVWLRRPSAFTGTFPPRTQWRLRQPPSSADPSLFVRRGSTPLFVLVYVDDVVFATADRVALAEKKLELQKRHTCTDLGELRHYLGLQITKERAARTITLSQSHMVQQVLQRFELQHSSVQRTPLAIDHRLTGPFRDEPFEPSGPYADLVGCLMYLMTCTRPDLAFPLSILARFVAPGRHHPVHWTAAVRVAKYLATTSGVRPELCFFVTGLG
ncbi:unnamed protein product [Closterium sp. NIES-53]